MKHIVLWFACLFAISVAFGQKLQWSLPQKISDRAYITESIGENQGGLFVIKKNNRTQEHDIVVERYSPDLRRTAMKEFMVHRNEYFLKIVLDSAGLRLFYATPEKDKKTLHVCQKNLNFNLNEEGND